jgi:two-component system copper resistance phosphate regulon response regulator CusR
MKIAVIEDERKLAHSLREGIEAEGYEVAVFYDGLSGEKELLESPLEYNLAIVDLLLPGKNGFEICESLRNNGLAIPILILTARDSVQDKVKALDTGVDDFLSKPFSFDELMARVRALIRRSTGNMTAKVTVGELELSRETRQLFRNAKEIFLTPTEFDILLLLTEKTGRVLSREEISTALWDTNEPTLSNVVDVHISNLRKKIDDGYIKKVVRTVRGMGYTVTA